MAKQRNIRNYVKGLPALVVGLVAFAACQEEFARVIPDVDTDDSVNVVYSTPKVLYIIADGARGESVRDAEAPNINSLLEHSIHTWKSLSDENAEGDGANWANMLTGVGQDKHRIVGNQFENNNLQDFPVVFRRVKQAVPNSDIRTFTTSPQFHEYLTQGADVRQVLGDDQAVKDAVIQALAVDTITFVTGHLSDIDAAGAAHGYDLSVPEYRDAILRFDSQIGEILAALRARPEYAQENWLVVITSSRGGDFEIPEHQNDNTIFSNPKVNTFTIMHASRYSTRFIGTPYLGNRFQGDFVRFSGQRKAQVTAGDNSIYNLGTTAFTIELKVKKNIGPNNNYRFYYPSILGKRPEWSSGWASNGWVIFLEDNFWMFNARGPGDGNQIRGAALADATWNSIAVVGVIRDNQRYIRTYTNGNFDNETNVTGWGSFDNDALLTMGYIQGNGHGEPDVYLSDVRIWKVALPDDVIRQYSCEVGVDPGHPYFDFLAGHWMVVGDSEDTIHDSGPLGSHMTLSGGDVSWDRLAEYLCAPSSDDLGTFVPRSVDIPAQIVSWFRIARQESWQFDGRVWLDR